MSDSRIPRALDRVVLRAMLKEPDDRFASAAEMRAELIRAGGSNGDAGAPARTATTSMADAATTVLSPGVESVPHLPAMVAARGGGTAVPTASAGAATAPAAEPEAVTRVLGRTIVPPRSAAALRTGTRSPDGSPKRAPSRVGTWFAAAAAATVVGLIVAAAAASPPTASVESTPAPTPSETVQVVPSPPPEPPPAPAEQDVPQPTVPDVSRHTVAEAAQALAAAGFIAGEIRRTDSPLPAGTVLESAPAAGLRAAAGAAIALVIASGSNTIPDVAGLDRDAAVAMLQSAGFAPSFGVRAAPASAVAGAILGTDPAGSTVLAVGTPVTILEAVPSAPTPTPTSVRPTPTPTPTPGAEQ